MCVQKCYAGQLIDVGDTDNHLNTTVCLLSGELSQTKYCGGGTRPPVLSGMFAAHTKRGFK